MDLCSCDLCQQAVPSGDIESKLASVYGDRVICRTCNETMGAKGEPPPPAVAPSLGGIRVVGVPRPRIGPGVAFALSMAAILLTLVAVVALLVRVENISEKWDAQFGVVAQDLGDLHEREIGTRNYMVTKAGQVAEEVLQGEIARVETIERQLGELRLALQAQKGSPFGEEQSPGPVDVDSLLLTTGDAMARVQELEQQILFLQARVFELLEGEPVASTTGEEPAADEPLILPGTVGELVARLGHEDPVERAIGLFGLSTVQDPGIVSHVIPLLEDPDVYLRVLAARTLERVNARSSAQALTNALEDPDPSVRQAAVSALRAITGQQFLFDPLGNREDRARAVRRWRVWWNENWRGFLYGER